MWWHHSSSFRVILIRPQKQEKVKACARPAITNQEPSSFLHKGKWTSQLASKTKRRHREPTSAWRMLTGIKGGMSTHMHTNTSAYQQTSPGLFKIVPVHHTQKRAVYSVCPGLSTHLKPERKLTINSLRWPWLPGILLLLESSNWVIITADLTLDNHPSLQPRM